MPTTITEDNKGTYKQKYKEHEKKHEHDSYFYSNLQIFKTRVPLFFAAQINRQILI